MSDDKGAVIPLQHKVEKEPWETPRVVAASVKEATAYGYGGNDDFVPPSS